MTKDNLTWTIRELLTKIDNIEFPEFQREGTVWDVDKKIKLIDSILRNIDIANIYLYKNPNGSLECIDGRQRINAIYSFVGLNDKADEIDSRYNNMFRFKSSDELLGSETLMAFNNKRYDELENDQQKIILDYKFNVIEINLNENEKEEELNLMFLRLQLGSPLNAGEKLNAMLGEMRDYIFKGPEALGRNQYFEFLQIPSRRFSKELTASQIAINFFSLEETKEFRKARFIDLQDFFKRRIKFSEEDKRVSAKLKERLNAVLLHLENKQITLKNRAIGITTFFFINNLIETNNQNQIDDFINFLKLFVDKLKEQVQKGINIDKEYQELLKFQNYISQAAVEKYAIENREKFLEEYFEYYLANNYQIKTT
jgi:hypothetical protein